MEELLSRCKVVGYKKIVFVGNRIEAYPSLFNKEFNLHNYVWPPLWKILEELNFFDIGGGGDNEKDWHNFKNLNTNIKEIEL